VGALWSRRFPQKSRLELGRDYGSSLAAARHKLTRRDEAPSSRWTQRKTIYDCGRERLLEEETMAVTEIRRDES
jgi:hypothetical protein